MAGWSGGVSVIGSIGVLEAEGMHFSSCDGNVKGLYGGIGVIGEESTSARWVSRAFNGADVEAYQHKGRLSRLVAVFCRPFLFAQPADGSRRRKYQA
jgi:hypothetical protein